MQTYRIARSLVAGVVLLAAAAHAAEPSASRPRYSDLRFEEDWSAIARGDAATADFFDPIKYVPLTDSGSAWLSFGAQLRERIELWDDFRFGDPPGADPDDVFLLSRLLVHGDLHVTPWLRVFAQGKSALVTDRDLVGGARPSDADELELQNGFLELKSPEWEGLGLTLRGGRQELSFGAQRLVSPLDWANARRTFDAVTGTLSWRTWTATGFAAHPVFVKRYAFNKWGPEDDFYGVHANGAVVGDTKADLYWLAVERDARALNGTSGDEQRHTLGGRVSTILPGTGFDAELEGAYQLGEIGSQDVSAYMIAAQLGWWLETTAMSPRFVIGLDWASGDDSPGGDVETFDQLYPLGHQYYGFIDAIGRQNAVDASLGVVLRPLAATTVSLTGHHFWRASDDDALYDAAAAVTYPGSAGGSNWIGAELDLLVRYQLDVHTALIGGYSHFFDGTFVEQAGTGRDIDFGYLIFQYTL
jgi:hypothetical protein